MFFVYCRSSTQKEKTGKEKIKRDTAKNIRSSTRKQPEKKKHPGSRSGSRKRLSNLPMISGLMKYERIEQRHLIRHYKKYLSIDFRKALKDLYIS